MRKRKVFYRILAACLLPMVCAAGGCAQAGSEEEINIVTKTNPIVTTTAASDESDAKESDGPDREEVNLDGGGFQCDWHEAVELTEEDALPEEELPVAFAEDENFYYDIYEDHVEVIQYIGTDTVVEVPAAYEGLPVTVLGALETKSWGSCDGFYESDVEKVVLPEGLLTIGNCAFMYCENLQEIVIPDSVTRIGYAAFEGTPWYEDLTDEFAVVGDGILIKYNGDDTSVVIPDTVKGICGAFQWDEDLVSVTIPDSVTLIAACAFDGCTSLESITIPESVTVLTSSFSACDSLVEVTGAENVTVLSSFYNCKKLTTYPFTEGLVEIGTGAFYACALTEVDLPQSLKIIGNYAFMDCYLLTTVTNGQNVIVIGEDAFKGSAWFESIADYFVTVGKNVLIGYNGEDTEVVVPDTVTYLGGAFSCYEAAYSDDELLSLTIPASVRGICSYAFNQHPNLEELTILGENVAFGQGACKGLELESFAVPEGTKVITYCMLGAMNLQKIEIPDSVVIIGDSAFYYSAPVSADSGDDEAAASEDGSLKSVEIPDSVLMIGSYAFEDCKDLTDITIPASVTRIGVGAFEGCSEELTIHGEAGSRAESYAAEYGINFVADLES